MEMLETLLQSVRSACAAFPDKRRGDVTYSMADIGLSAFSLFFLQSESFLAHQRTLEEGRKTSNCQSLFGMTAIPTDNHIRAMLDPVPPSCLQPAFDQSLDMLRRQSAMLVTSLSRRSLLADPALAAEVHQLVDAEGSSEDLAFAGDMTVLEKVAEELDRRPFR